MLLSASQNVTVVRNIVSVCLQKSVATAWKFHEKTVHEYDRFTTANTESATSSQAT